MCRIIFLYLLLIGLLHSPVLSAQVVYPYPIKKISLQNQGETVSMAYMDIRPASPNGKTVVLLHGKNFNGYYWKNLIPTLSLKGFRVIVPDQVGWGRSDKPVLAYSFHLLASNTALLLDTLHIPTAIIVGHSMGGMLATRFAIMYPQRVEKLVLENPIGLEDYKRFVPYQPFDKLLGKEKNATYESYKKYQQTYYPSWKPEYEEYVKAQAEVLSDPGFATIAKVNALTYEMIYQQPVCYEWGLVKSPVLLIIGQSDRTVVGKDLLTEEQKKVYGQYPSLGRKTKQQLKNVKLIELPGVGHIPHIQEPALFQQHLLQFIN